MVKPASIPRISGPLACLALLLSSQPAFAQEAKKPASSKEPSEEAVFIPIEYRPPPYQISVGFRISGKAKVKFSGLGNIPYNSVPGDNITSGIIARVYDNGDVGPDDSRDIEDNKIVKDDGRTNIWAFSSSNQLQPNDFPNAKEVRFESNRVDTAGATLAAESGSSLSWDIEVSRQLGGNKRFSWGIIFGAGLNDINAKTSGTVKGNLRTLTDLYALAEGEGAKTGTLLTTTSNNVTSYLPYISPGPKKHYLTEQGKNADGTLRYVLDDSGNATTTPYMVPLLGPDNTQLWEIRDNSIRLGALPFSRNDIATADGVDVTGYWQVKGAYLTSRFGPYFAWQINRHFALRASAGLTLTILGAQFRFNESYLVPSLANYIKVDTANIRNDSTVTSTLGYFASGEVEWFMTQRTGFFVGAAYESYTRDLRISMPGTTQTADISASVGAVFRSGITTRF
ncbi:MAG: hypothetical protein IPL39_06920 [Opitutaceae bacterium]|nr:hypothetical protein [Opitutaceae bacterium]